MPISAHFENDNHLVIWTFEGRWTWDDYYSQRDTINHKIEEMPHLVNMIVDITNGSILPQNVLSHTGTAVRKAPHNLGVIVIVGPSLILRTFFQFFKRMYGMFQPEQDKNLHMVSTLQEAHAILHQKLPKND